MNRPVIICFASLSAVLLLAWTSASSKEADCSVARDPRRCEAQQVAREACSGLQGQARSTCIREALPPPDCSHAPNTTQCQAKQAAAEVCKEKRSKAHRQCLRDYKP